MVISEPAFAIMEDTCDSLLASIASVGRKFRWRRRAGQPLPLAGLGPSLATPGPAVWLASHDGAPAQARKLPAPFGKSLVARLRPEPPDFAERSPDERRAWAIAHRGIARAREGRIDEARDDFATAATLDPTLDLTTLPGFWRLSQAAHQAAVEAYELAGRCPDAAALTATVRAMFRPRPLNVKQRSTGSAG